METPTCNAPREPAGRCRGDAGAGLVEYALLLALIVVACIGAVTFLGGNLNSNLSRSTSKITAASP
jgi:Flp pilus assembly pilin Flp